MFFLFQDIREKTGEQDGNDEGNTTVVTADDDDALSLGTICSEFTLFRTKKSAVISDGAEIPEGHPTDDPVSFYTDDVNENIATANGLMVVVEVYNEDGTGWFEADTTYTVTPYWKTPDRLIVIGESYQIQTNAMTATKDGIARMVDGSWKAFFPDNEMPATESEEP